MNILIASANGYGNAGDDICAVVSEALLQHAAPHADVTITAPPFDEELARQADVIVLGGGGIIYDANIDNMENYLKYVEYGIKHNKITVGLGLGEQGIVTKEGEKRYKRAFNAMDLVTVRSQGDAARLRKFGVTQEKSFATQDLGFSYNYERYAKRYERKQWLRNKFGRDRKPKLGIVISNQEHLVNDLKLFYSKQEKVNALHFKNSLEKHIKDISENYDVTLITQSRDDLDMAEHYKSTYGCKVYSYHSVDDLHALLNTYADQDLILTQRFHGVVFSFCIGVPVIALGYHGQKQYKLLKDMGLAKKLIMYHKPERLERMIHLLSNAPEKLDSYVIKLTDFDRAFLKVTQHMNVQRTYDLLNNVNTDYVFNNLPWPARYALIAKYLPQNQDVLDIGAGEEYVTEWIKPKRYVPIDIHACTERTIVRDLDKDGLPKLDGEFDYILAQGVFEYLNNSESIMKDLHNYADKMVTTGYFLDKQSKQWKRLWTEDEFEKALEKAGWKISSKEKVPGVSQYVYYCEAS